MISKLVHAGLEPAEIAKYIGVHEKTVAIYHRAHKSFAMKAATVLSAYGPTMSGTSNLGSAVGVATSLLHPPSALVQPQALVSVSSVSAQPQPHVEIKVEHPGPPSPATPMNPSVAWDVDNEVWDYDNYPLTQPSDRAVWSSDDGTRTTHRLRSKKRSVPATPPKMVKGEQPGSIATPPRATKKQGVCKELVAKPKPKPKPRPVPKPRAPGKVSKYWACGVCDQNIVEASPSIEHRGQGCDSCGVFWHLKCIGLKYKPKWGSVRVASGPASPSAP